MRSLISFLSSATIVLTIKLLITPIDAITQTANPCTCNDVNDLIALLGKYDVAIDTFEQYERTVKPNDVYNEIEPEPNPTKTTKGASLTNAVNDAMKLAERGTVSETPCMKSMVDLRKSLLKSSTDAYKSLNKLRPIDDPMNFMPLKTYIKLERDALLNARSEILRRLRTLKAAPNSCRVPGDWFGTITVTENRREGVTESVPGTDRFNQGTERVQVTTMTRRGTIFVDPNTDKPSSFWRADQKLTKTTVHNGMVDCDTSHKENLVAVKSGTHIEITGIGFRPVELEINPGISDDGFKFTISLQIPSLDIINTISENSTAMGGCYGPNRESKSGKSSSDLAPQQVESSGPISVDFGRVNGSDSQDLVPRGFQLPSGVTLTHTVVINYNLYKLK